MEIVITVTVNGGKMDVKKEPEEPKDKESGNEWIDAVKIEDL